MNNAACIHVYMTTHVFLLFNETKLSNVPFLFIVNLVGGPPGKCCGKSDQPSHFYIYLVVPKIPMKLHTFFVYS